MVVCGKVSLRYGFPALLARLLNRTSLANSDDALHRKLVLTICIEVPVAPTAMLPSTVTPDLNRAALLVSILALNKERLFNEAVPNTLTLP
jgi:hypothetical protein